MTYFARPRSLFATAWLTGMVLACSGEVDPNDYDRSCSEATDCMVIFTGERCSCSCDVSAINVSDREAYLDDRGSGDCSVDCGPCPQVEAVCTAGICEAATVP